MMKLSVYRSIYLFSFIGLALGIILCYLATNHPRLDLLSFFILSSLLYTLAYNEQHRLRLAATSLFVALFITSPIFFLPINEIAQLNPAIAWFAGVFPIMVYIAHCFHAACHQNNRMNPSYMSLFNTAWNTPLFLGTALIFYIVGGFLIFLSVYFFIVIGVKWIHGYLFLIRFVTITSSTLFFLGLGMAHQQIHTINKMRLLLLRMMSFLFPFLAVPSALYVLFCLILCLKDAYLQLILHHSSSDFHLFYDGLKHVLTLMTFGGIFIFNAIFQDGNTVQKESRVMYYALKSYRILLFILSLMLFNLFLPNSYDSFNIVNPLLFALSIVFYCLAYAISAFLPKEEEKKLIRNANISISLFFVCSVILFNDFSISQRVAATPLAHLIPSTVPTRVQIRQNNPAQITADAKTQQELAFDQEVQRQQQLFAKYDIRWDSNLNEATYLVQSKNETLGICRTKYNNDYQIGVYKNKTCTITYGGEAYQQNSFQLLSHATNKVVWVIKQSRYSDGGLALGVEYVPDYDHSGYTPPPRALFTCKVEQPDSILLGKVVEHVCNVDINGKEASFEQYRVLALGSS